MFLDWKQKKISSITDMVEESEIGSAKVFNVKVTNATLLANPLLSRIQTRESLNSSDVPAKEAAISKTR
jgi:hypothetical protein